MVETQSKKKILVALDASERSFEVIRYLGKTKLFNEEELVLFNVYDDVPEFYYDMGGSPQYSQAISEITAWKHEQKRQIEDFMAKARTNLLENGFSGRNISVVIQSKQSGIARDIINESHKEGYKAVMIGRKGESMMREILLGSVANKLLNSLNHLPLALVGRDIVSPEKVLMGLDRSEHFRRIINFVTANFPKNTEFRMIHVIRSKSKSVPVEVQMAAFFLSYIEGLKKEVAEVLDKAKSRLLEEGFDKNQISTDIITDRRSRAKNIYREAHEKKYGTIVLGRKGLSRIQEFFMGRVGVKVIEMAKTQAVWIVN